MAERAVAIKLSVKDQESVLAALRAVGKEGEAMAVKLDGAMKRSAAAATEKSRALDKAKASAGGLGAAIAELDPRLAAFGRSAGLFAGVSVGIAGVVAAVTALVSKIRQAAQEIEDLDKVSASIGVAAEDLQRLQFAGSRAGIGIQEVRQGLTALQQKLAEAAIGKGEGKDVLAQLGISARTAAGEVKSARDSVLEIAAAMQRYDRTDRLSIAKALGLEGMLPLLEQGREGVEKMMARGDALGVVMRGGLVREIAEANRQLREMDEVHAAKVKAALATLAKPLAGASLALEEIGVKILEWAPKVLQILMPVMRLMEFADKLSGQTKQFSEAEQLVEKIKTLESHVTGYRAMGDSALGPGERQSLIKAEKELVDSKIRLGELQKVLISGRDLPSTLPPYTPPADRRLTDTAAAKAGEDEKLKLYQERLKLERDAELAAAEDKRQRIRVEMQHELEELEGKHARGEVLAREFADREELIRTKAAYRIAEVQRDEHKKLIEEQIKAQERAAQEAFRIWEQFGSDLTSILTDALSNSFKFDRGQIESSVMRMAGQLANQQIFNPLLSGMGLAKPGAGAQSSPLFNLGSSLSGGATLFGQPLFGPSAGEMTNATREAAAGGLPTPQFSQGLVANAVGGAATGYSIGNIMGGLLKGTLNQENAGYGGAVGGAAGSVIGQIIGGPIGGMIGQLLGSAGGGLFGGLFGPKTPSVGPNASVRVGRDPLTGRLSPGAANADNGGSVSSAVEFGQAMADVFNKFADRTGTTITQSLRAETWDGKFVTSLASGADGNKVIEETLLKALKRTASSTSIYDTYFEGFSDAAMKAIKNSAASDLEGLLGDVDFAESLTDIVAGLEAARDTLKQVELAARQASEAQVEGVLDFVERAQKLGFGAESETARSALVDQLLLFADKSKDVSETAKAVAVLAAHFGVLRDNTAALAIDEARIAAAETAASAELRRGFDDGIRLQVLGIMDPVAAALDEFDKAALLRVQDAKLLGADLIQVERANALLRQQVIEQSSGGAVSSLRQFYDDITFGGISGASPLASLEGTRASFLAASAEGDRARIEEMGRALLTSSRGAYASGAGFQSDLDLVRNIVGPLVQGADNAVVAAINAAGGESVRLQSILINEVAGLRAETAEQRGEIARLNAMLQRLLAAA